MAQMITSPHEESALKILSDGVPRTTMDLFGILKAHDVQVASSNELSVYLSSAKHLFENNRRTGWTVRKI